MKIYKNPYLPPKTEAPERRHGMVSTINGLMIGVGIGLQMCDFLDLTATDFTALYGWRNGIVLSGLIGTVIGYRRTDPIAWKWIVMLGWLAMIQGSIIAFTVFSESPANLYTITMIATGSIYVIFGAYIGWRCGRNAGLPQT